MIALEPHVEGVVMSVRAQPGARQSGLRGELDGALKVCVTQIAEKGKANRAIVDVLCKRLKLKRSQVELIAGELSPQKKFLIRDVAREVLAERVRAALAEAAS